MTLRRPRARSALARGGSSPCHGPHHLDVDSTDAAKDGPHRCTVVRGAYAARDGSSRTVEACRSPTRAPATGPSMFPDQTRWWVSTRPCTTRRFRRCWRPEDGAVACPTTSWRARSTPETSSSTDVTSRKRPWSDSADLVDADGLVVGAVDQVGRVVLTTSGVGSSYRSVRGLARPGPATTVAGSASH